MDKSRHDLSKLAIGIPIQTAIKIKPNSGYLREDIKLSAGMVSLLDVNNRVQKDYVCGKIFDSASSVFKLFEGTCGPLLTAVLEGVNVAIVNFGTTESEKSLNMEGEGADPGLINYFVKSIFESLDEKTYRLSASRNTGGNSQVFKYSIKMQYVEIVDEEICDLLMQSNSDITGSVQVVPDEWDGVSISNCSWLSCDSAHHLLDSFVLARRNRTQASNEFGSLRPKASSILVIEVLQEAFDGATNEKNIVVARIHFVDTPGMEKLNEDPEVLRIQEGNSLNRGLLALSEVLLVLSKDSKDFVRYEDSVLTQLLKDIIGGNCLTQAIFCLQNGDVKNSELVLEYMKYVQKISNFPVVNDSRQIGLLRSFRAEMIYLNGQLSLHGPGSVEAYSSHISELEKQLIDNNLEKLKFIEQRSQLTERIRDLKESYNKIVKEKVDLVSQLIDSEEKNLIISKALVEMKIENTQLAQKKEMSEVDVKDKVLYAESQVLEANIEKERALKAINEMQSKDRKILEDKRELEIEFVALKKNYLAVKEELKLAQETNETLSLEILNIVNSNKALTGDSNSLSNQTSTLKNSNATLQVDNAGLKKKVMDLEKQVFAKNLEIEKLKSDVTRFQLNAEIMQNDVQGKKVLTEKEMLQKSHLLDNEAHSKIEKFGEKAERLERENQHAHAETVAVTRQLKIAQRKVQQLEELLQDLQVSESKYTEENHRLSAQLDELREQFRNKLVLTNKEIGDNRLKATREELIKSYSAHEAELVQGLKSEKEFNQSQQRIIRGLRVYARNLKNLAEDWAPLGKELPEILLTPPPILLEDEEKSLTQRGLHYELERLRTKNTDLEAEVKTLKSQMVLVGESYLKGNPKDRIWNEIEFLKGNSRPGTGDLEVIRRERNQLREENRKLHQDIREIKVRSGGSEGGGYGDVERLRKRVQELEQGFGNSSAGPGNTKALQQKIFYLEEVLRKLEKERSELSVRATMAEEQLKNLQEHMNSSLQNSQKKINEYKKLVQQLKGGRSGELNSGVGETFRPSYY